MPTPRKPRKGIIIQYEHPTDASGQEHFKARFSLGAEHHPLVRKKTADFITNREIRSAMESPDSKVDRMELVINRRENRAVWSVYYPFGIYSSSEPFQRKGIAQLLELKILTNLQKKFPGILVSEPLEVDASRRRQWRARGVPRPTYRNLMPIEEIIALLRKKIAKDTRLHRNAPRPEKPTPRKPTRRMPR